MADVEKHEKLVEKLAQENAKLNQELKDSNAAQKAEIDRVITAMVAATCHLMQLLSEPKK